MLVPCHYLLNTTQTVFAPFPLLHRHHHHHHSNPYGSRSSIIHHPSATKHHTPVHPSSSAQLPSLYDSPSTATHDEVHSNSRRHHSLGLCCTSCNHRQEFHVGTSHCDSSGQHSRQQLVCLLLPLFHTVTTNHMPPTGTLAVTRTTRTSALTSKTLQLPSNLAATIPKRPFIRYTVLRLSAPRNTRCSLRQGLFLSRHQHTPLIFRMCTLHFRICTLRSRTCTHRLRIYTQLLLHRCTRALPQYTCLLIPRYTPGLLHQCTRLLHTAASQTSLLHRLCATSSSRSALIVSSVQMSAR
jgi:hypothetical protein